MQNQAGRILEKIENATVAKALASLKSTVDNSPMRTPSVAPKGQPLVKGAKPVYNVEYQVTDPIERLAVLILQDRKYVVFKHHCGPAVVK